MTRTLKLALVLAVAVTLSACGAGPGGEQAKAPAASQEKTTAQAANTASTQERTGSNAGQASAGAGGEQAPNFAVTTLDGEEFRLSEKRGEVVALFFMAGWCGSCIPEAQSWAKLYPVYEDKGLNVLVVSIDPNDTLRTIEGFRQAGKIGPLPWAIDKTGDVARPLGIQALDSTVIIDRDGRIAYRDSAPTPYETLESELKEVL
jgi:peroxiredoxin